MPAYIEGEEHMPTYEYRCRTCNARFELQQSFSEDSLTHCPTAGSQQSPAACMAPGEGEVRKVFSAPSITFKGDGFYKTDSRAGSTRTTNGSEAKKSGDGASEAAGSAKETSGETSDGTKKSAAKESGGDSGGAKSSDRNPAPPRRESVSSS